MSRTSQFLEMVAATAGCVSVNQYLAILERDRKRDQEYEEGLYWKSIEDGTYWNVPEDDSVQEVS